MDPFRAAVGQLCTAAAAQLFIRLFSTVFRSARASPAAATFLPAYSGGKKPFKGRRAAGSSDLWANCCGWALWFSVV